MIAPALLALALSAAPARLALLPLEAVGLEPEQARSVEARVRAELERAGVALIPQEQTRAAVAADPSLQSCLDAACLARAAATLEAGGVIAGVVTGLGSFQSVALRRADPSGESVAHSALALASPADDLRPLVCPLLGPGGCAQGEEPRPTSWRRPAGLAASLAAVAALGVGIGFGANAAATESAIESGTTGCAGIGEAYAQCMAGAFASGRSSAAAANVLFGVGAALGAGGAALLLWPEDGPALSAAPTAGGVSIHATVRLR